MLETQPQEKGPGVGLSFVLGLAGNIVFWVVAAMLLLPRVPSRSIPIYVFGIGMVRLAGNGLLILIARNRQREALAKGLIIAASLAFLFDAACWGLVSTK